jgi:uncharacterized protein (UPF0147 family)
VKLKTLNETPPWEWPENASTLVLDTLKDRSASKEDRLLAAELAGDAVVLSEEIAEALLAILKAGEEEDDVRSAAAISLGPGLEEANLRDDEDPDDSPAFSDSFIRDLQKTLHNLYSDLRVPADVRRSVLEASVRDPQDWHSKAVRDAYARKDGDWRLTSVFCMRYVTGFEKEILDSLKSADPEIHYNAVEAAGNWELDEAWPHIARLVTSKNTEKSLLLAAIWAAAAIRPSEIQIIEPLSDSDDEDIAEAAMDAMTEAEFVADWDSDTEEDEDEDFDPDDDPDEEGKNGNR